MAGISRHVCSYLSPMHSRLADEHSFVSIERLEIVLLGRKIGLRRDAVNARQEKQLADAGNNEPSEEKVRIF